MTVKEPIRKIKLRNGTVRYRLVVNIGYDENGKRKQITRTYDKLKDARAELSRIRHETGLGTYVQPAAETVNSYLDEYLKGATRGRRASTARNYRDAFRPVRERLGDRPLQSLTKADIEDVIDWILTSGRKRGGKPGTGLSARSARLTLGRLTAALEMATRRGNSSATWPSWSSRRSTPRGSVNMEQSRSAKVPRCRHAIDCTRAGGCRCMASGVVKSWACAGRTLILRRRR